MTIWDFLHQHPIQSFILAFLLLGVTEACVGQVCSAFKAWANRKDDK